MRVVLGILKSSNFVVQKLALHQNGVKVRQPPIGDIRISLATSNNVVRCRMTVKVCGYPLPTH